MTEREYGANIDGTNIVFGAVIGFVLAGSNQLSTWDFVTIQLYTATTAIMILYLGSSVYRLFYAACSAVAIGALPVVLAEFPNPETIGKLHPTLAVWALMITAIELVPRVKAETQPGLPESVPKGPEQ